MSALTHGIGCGIALGIVGALLAQQLGYIELSNIGPTLIYLVGGALLGAVVFGALGWALGRRALARSAPPPDGGTSD